MSGKTTKFVASIVFGVMTLALARPERAGAATIIANDPADVIGVNGVCSLREAISSINASAPINADCPNMAVAPFGTNDTINLTVNTQIAINGVSENTNLTGDFDILRPVVINAVGPFGGPVPAMCAIAPALPAPCVSAGAKDRVFDVFAPNVIFNNFSVAGGDAPFPEGGGAIRINGPAAFLPPVMPDLTLKNMTVGRSFANIMPNMDGGAIWNNGKLVVTISTVQDSDASRYGGGIYNTTLGTMLLDGAAIQMNRSAINGGGVYNEGDASSINNTSIFSNTAGSNGGGIYNASTGVAGFSDTRIFQNIANAGLGVYNTGSFSGWTVFIFNNINSPSSNGGGIYNSGNLLIASASRIFGNAVGSGGGIYNLKRADVSDSLIYLNTSQIGPAGGIYNMGEFALTQSVVSSNTLAGFVLNGAGIWNETGGVFTSTHSLVQANLGADMGGGVGNDVMARYVMIGGAIRNHSVTSDGANIHNSGDLLMSASATLDSGKATNTGGNLYNASAGNAQIVNSDLISGSAISGGGVWNSGSALMINTRVLSGSVSQYGGGIYNSGFVTLTGGTQIDKNTAAFGGGLFVSTNAATGIFGSRVYGNFANVGGGMETSPTSTLVISNSAIYSNSATNIGGGLYTQGFTSIDKSAITSNTVTTSAGGWGNFGTAWVTNTTFSGNYAGNASSAILNTIGGAATGSITLTNVTIAKNTSPSTYALGKAGAAWMSLKNTLIADNSPANCGISGALVSLGNNLDSGSTCALAGLGDLSNAPANLAPLAMNAPGNTPTHALMAGSAAINSGSNTGCPAIDQRGVARPLGGTCDIGAYESRLFPRAFMPSTMRDFSAGW